MIDNYNSAKFLLDNILIDKYWPAITMKVQKLVQGVGRYMSTRDIVSRVNARGIYRLGLEGGRRYASVPKAAVDKGFYKVTEVPMHDSAASDPTPIIGEVVNHALDLTSVRPGETIDVPYEVTISHSLRDFWQSAFYSYDRIHSSTPFARSLGLQDQVVPFSLMLFLAGAMSHADKAKIQVGFSRAQYHWPAFAGDTFTKRFVIRSLRTTSDQKHSIFNIHCMLINQREQVVFSCDKTMLFPFIVSVPSEVEVPLEDVEHGQDFLAHLIRQVEILQQRGSHTLTSVRPGQLLLHTLTRPLSATHCMQLATLARLTHERHFNTKLYREDELYVPGGLVLGLTTSLSSRDLHEALYEELIGCNFPNNLAPNDAVGAISFIQGALYTIV